MWSRFTITNVIKFLTSIVSFIDKSNFIVGSFLISQHKIHIIFSFGELEKCLSKIANLNFQNITFIALDRFILFVRSGRVLNMIILSFSKNLYSSRFLFFRFKRRNNILGYRKKFLQFTFSFVSFLQIQKRSW